jgi:hypothetical protein
MASNKLIFIDNLHNFADMTLSLFMSNSVFINDCSNGTIDIPIKINHVLIRNCKNLKINLSGCIAGIDIINSKNNFITNKFDSEFLIDIYKSQSNIINQFKTEDNMIYIRSYFSSDNEFALHDNERTFYRYIHPLNMLKPFFFGCLEKRSFIVSSNQFF